MPKKKCKNLGNYFCKVCTKNNIYCNSHSWKHEKLNKDHTLEKFQLKLNERKRQAITKFFYKSKIEIENIKYKRKSIA